MNLLIIAMLFLPLVSSQRAPTLEAQLEKPFKIKIAQEVSVDNLRIRFDSVAHDRRCPCETECSSHRNAAVIFRVESPTDAAKYIVLTAMYEPVEIQARGYKIRLISLYPCSLTHNGYIEKAKYEATLLVRKSDEPAGNDKGERRGKPNFSGRWAHRQALDAGSTLTISQVSARLSVTRSGFARAQEYITRDIYFIDGREHLNTRTEYVERRPSKKKEKYKVTRVKSIVRWKADGLLIVDDDGQSEWNLSDNGNELIRTMGDKKVVYRRVS